MTILTTKSLLDNLNLRLSFPNQYNTEVHS